MGDSDYYKLLASPGEETAHTWRTVHDQIIDSCMKVWDAVKDVLCIDSPEGHADTDVGNDELDIGIKDTLSFSWRALKEARSFSRSRFIMALTSFFLALSCMHVLQIHDTAHRPVSLVYNLKI